MKENGTLTMQKPKKTPGSGRDVVETRSAEEPAVEPWASKEKEDERIPKFNQKKGSISNI